MSKSLIQSGDYKKKIAFCGTRGLPANYGGFETAVDEISKRIVSKGYSCDVFCRMYDKILIPKEEEYSGRNLIYVKGSKSRKLDTFLSSLRTGIYILNHRKEYDYILWFNNANFFGIIITLLSGIPVAVNTDGLEWRRDKWSWPFKLFYFVSSFLICILCKNLISDSIAIQSYYKNKFWKKTEFIPYGCPNPSHQSADEESKILNKYNLIPNHYFFQVTRFEPDNLPYEIIEGFRKSNLAKDGYKFVLVGFKDSTPYSQKIKAVDGRNGIVVLDAIYNKNILMSLRKNAFSYVHGNSVGGTNPALLEAMVYCKRILAIDSPFSKEVLGDCGVLFDRTKIEEGFNKIIHTAPENSKMFIDVRKRYDWNKVAIGYEKIINGYHADYSASNSDSLGNDSVKQLYRE